MAGRFYFVFDLVSTNIQLKKVMGMQINFVYAVFHMTAMSDDCLSLVILDLTGLDSVGEKYVINVLNKLL